MPRFRYHPAVTDRFPTIVGGLIHARGVTSGMTPTDLAEAFHAEQAAALARIGGTPLSELPTIAAWRRTFRGFGVDPTAYRSAAEALLRRLTKQGSIPSIGALVDLGNLVSIRHGLPVSVMDQRVVVGGTTVRFAEGSERFTDLGSGASEAPDPGEVIFADEAESGERAPLVLAAVGGECVGSGHQRDPGHGRGSPCDGSQRRGGRPRRPPGTAVVPRLPHRDGGRPA